VSIFICRKTSLLLCHLHHHVIGKFSLVKRQIDVAILGELAGYRLFGAVECKHFNRNVDVKVVEAFLSFLDDVGANFGVMITNKGYSRAAKARAKVKDIRLEILSLEELRVFHFDYEVCQLCNQNYGQGSAIVDFDYGYAVEADGGVALVDIGHCGWCNGIHVRCQKCGTVTPIYEFQYGDMIGCAGDCGLRIVVRNEHVGDGLFEEKIVLFFDEENEDANMNITPSWVHRYAIEIHLFAG